MNRTIHRVRQLTLDITSNTVDVEVSYDDRHFNSATIALDVVERYPELNWTTVRDIIEAADELRLTEAAIETLFYHDDGCDIKVIKEDKTLFTHTAGKEKS